MYTYIYIYIICIHVYTYIYIYTYIHTYICTHRYSTGDTGAGHLPGRHGRVRLGRRPAHPAPDAGPLRRPLSVSIHIYIYICIYVYIYIYILIYIYRERDIMIAYNIYIYVDARCWPATSAPQRPGFLFRLSRSCAQAQSETSRSFSESLRDFPLHWLQCIL